MNISLPAWEFVHLSGAQILRAMPLCTLKPLTHTDAVSEGAAAEDGSLMCQSRVQGSPSPTPMPGQESQSKRHVFTIKTEADLYKQVLLSACITRQDMKEMNNGTILMG